MRRGPIPVVLEVRGNKAYQVVSLTTLFQLVNFSSGMTQLHIENESDTNCEYSFNGVSVKGIVLNRSHRDRTISNESGVYVRLQSGTGTAYVEAY